MSPPCSGPNCPYAASQGDKAYAAFAEWLMESYDIPTVEHIKETIARDPRMRRFRRHTLESHAKLREAVRDLFVSEACDTW